MTVRYLVGDVFERLGELDDGSVDLVVTSPPFLALRSYLPSGHPDKDKEIGNEPTPGEFIDTLLRVTGELRRVLAPHGSIAVELGDTNTGSGGAGGDYGPDGLRDGQPVFEGSAAKHRSKPASMSAVATEDSSPPPRLRTRRQLAGWPKDKSRCLIPELYRIGLVYGIHPLTGEESPAGEWIARNIVTWCKRNPVPGYLGDRWRYGTSDIVVATTSPTRYWDDLATRHENPRAHEGTGKTVSRVGGMGEIKGAGSDADPTYRQEPGDRQAHPYGAPMLDWWEITPKGYPGAHYAVYPPDLIVPLVKAMSPIRVCRTCGKPSECILERQPHNLRPHMGESGGIHPGNNGGKRTGGDTRFATTVTDLGWTDCGHDDWRPGLVLDPFAGTGTTLHVAEALGRDAVGVDLDERNLELYKARSEEPGFMGLRQGILL